jgi:hypothetical protein
MIANSLAPTICEAGSSSNLIIVPIEYLGRSLIPCSAKKAGWPSVQIARTPKNPQRRNSGYHLSRRVLLHLSGGSSSLPITVRFIISGHNNEIATTDALEFQISVPPTPLRRLD